MTAKARPLRPHDRRQTIGMKRLSARKKKNSAARYLSSIDENIKVA
jgi:hypothetical protein